MPILPSNSVANLCNCVRTNENGSLRKESHRLSENLIRSHNGATSLQGGPIAIWQWRPRWQPVIRPASAAPTSGYDAASFYPVLRGSAARRHGLESIAEARF
jgi:hypothetical protein